MVTKTIDIYPESLHPTDVRWPDAQNALVIDGAVSRIVGGGSGGSRDQRFILRWPSTPRGIVVDSVTFHHVVARGAETPEGGRTRLNVYSFQPVGSPPYDRLIMGSLTAYFDNAELQNHVHTLPKSAGDWFAAYSPTLTAFELVLAASSNPSGDPDAVFLIDGFFLRVTYTYDEEDQQPNLVRNGFAEEESNANFPGSTFTREDAVPGTRGSFKYPGDVITRFSDDPMPVDPTGFYHGSTAVKGAPSVPGTRFLLGVECLDRDLLSIGSHHTIYLTGSLTTLARDLNPGDTTIYLTSAAGWNDTLADNARGIIIWAYRDSTDYLHPPETYSRLARANAFAPGSLDRIASSVTMSAPWAAATYPAGTPISQGGNGNLYKYFITGSITAPLPDLWTKFEGLIGGVDYSGRNIIYMFSPGTAYARCVALLNRDVAGSQTLLSSIYFGAVPVRQIAAALKADPTLTASLLKAIPIEAALSTNPDLQAAITRAQLLGSDLAASEELAAEIIRAQLIGAPLTQDAALDATIFRVFPELVRPRFELQSHSNKLKIE